MLGSEELDSIVAELASRPGHEKVRAHLHRLLVGGMKVDSRYIGFEEPVPVVRGRIDALLGWTVFELKSDLRAERNKAEEGLCRYLQACTNDSGDDYVGIATDGADFIAYFLRADAVVEVASYRVDPLNPRGLLPWLQGTISCREGLVPDQVTIRGEFGRGSLAAHRALTALGDEWAIAIARSEARLKRELWEQLLGIAYGAEIGSDHLFMQHTYLAVVAKAVVWSAIADSAPPNAAALLRGDAFVKLGITGQADADFFDWMLLTDGGSEVVMRIWRQVTRFRWRQAQGDVLKPVYEGLIDPDTRHDLGEYYTPDWLARRMVDEAVRQPLVQRIVDPSCGSGTFLFHAVRRVLTEAKAAGWPSGAALRTALENIAGIDVHPVAVIFARVTFVLALLPAFDDDCPDAITIPVYMGDALQWNVANERARDRREILSADAETMEILVPELVIAEPRPTRYPPVVLKFPSKVAANAQSFDPTLAMMMRLSEQRKPAMALDAWMRRNFDFDDQAREVLCATYDLLGQLRDEGRDHVWAYVVRNVATPLWLASEGQKADVLLGNPPWLAFRYMAGEFQERFRRETDRAGLWAGGKLSTHQDLSGYFFLRSSQLYLKPQGRVAMVMPYACLSRQAFAGFRSGEFALASGNKLRVRYSEPWVFGPDVRPLFPVPSCVLFAEWHHGSEPAVLPQTVRTHAGVLPRRDADADEADAHLTDRVEPWPQDPANTPVSYYRRRFRQGATLVPRRLVLVEHAQISAALPTRLPATCLRSRTSNLDKAPWNQVEPLEQVVERDFVQPVLLGESVLPYRVLRTALGVVPWNSETERLMDSTAASENGYPNLSDWLASAEANWEQHKRSELSFQEQLDFYGKLTRQYPIAPIRVVYTKAGSLPAACVVRDQHAIIDHKLYWAPVGAEEEGRYLCAVLNSEALRARLAQYQSQGLWGARDIDKYPFNLAVPRFNPRKKQHRRLAELAQMAENAAESVSFGHDVHYSKARRLVRDSLAMQAWSDEIETLVVTLLDTGQHQ